MAENETKETASFVQEWEQYKKRVNDLSAIVLDSRRVLEDLDKTLADQITHLNKTVAMLNAQTAQVSALSDTLMAVLELTYSKKKITPESMEAKIVEFTVSTSKEMIKSSVESKAIIPTEVISENTIIVYKTADISYAYTNISELGENVTAQKVGDKFPIKYLNKDQKVVEIEAEIIELYDSVAK
jgi:hypothetical protein